MDRKIPLGPGQYRADYHPAKPDEKAGLSAGHFRSAKIYITLPSEGKYYPDDCLDMPESGELPVMPMTAKDELALKTPDALLSGQATVDLIQSCIPNIKNAKDQKRILNYQNREALANWIHNGLLMDFENRN